MFKNVLITLTFSLFFFWDKNKREWELQKWCESTIKWSQKWSMWPVCNFSSHTIDLCDEQTKSKLLFAEKHPLLQQSDHGVNGLNLRTVWFSEWIIQTGFGYWLNWFIEKIRLQKRFIYKSAIITFIINSPRRAKMTGIFLKKLSFKQHEGE